VTRQTDMFLGGQRLQMNQSIELTIDSLNAYGPSHEHWAIAWSGGKDSTTLLTLVVYLIDVRQGESAQDVDGHVRRHAARAVAALGRGAVDHRTCASAASTCAS
jgi:hypothetical protein